MIGNISKFLNLVSQRIVIHKIQKTVVVFITEMVWNPKLWGLWGQCVVKPYLIRHGGCGFGWILISKRIQP